MLVAKDQQQPFLTNTKHESTHDRHPSVVVDADYSFDYSFLAGKWKKLLQWIASLTVPFHLTLLNKSDTILFPSKPYTPEKITIFNYLEKISRILPLFYAIWYPNNW